MNRFLIAQSALGKNNHLAIIQTIKDSEAIIEWIEGHIRNDTAYYQHFNYTNIHGEPKQWTLVIHSLAIGLKVNPQKVESLMKSAWRYYWVYLLESEREKLNAQIQTKWW